MDVASIETGIHQGLSKSSGGPTIIQPDFSLRYCGPVNGLSECRSRAIVGRGPLAADSKIGRAYTFSAENEIAAPAPVPDKVNTIKPCSWAAYDRYRFLNAVHAISCTVGANQ